MVTLGGPLMHVTTLFFVFPLSFRQVKRMIGGIGNVLFSNCSQTENMQDLRVSMVNLSVAKCDFLVNCTGDDHPFVDSQTLPCVHSKRPCVYRHHAHMLKSMCACCPHSRGRFEWTHGGFQRATPHTPHKLSSSKELPFPSVTFSRMMASVVDMPDVDHAGTGSPRRRRERRHRAYLRYARMSVAMALAEANHHTAPRGQKTARAEKEVEVHEVYEVLREEAAHDDATVAFLVSQTLLAEKEAKEVEELVADLAKREQKLLEELERHRASFKRGDPGSRVEVAAAWWWLAKTAFMKRGITASPGRYTNTGRAAPQQHDPGGASDTGHRQTP